MHFYEVSQRLSKRSLNIHMSRVNFDKQYKTVSCLYLELNMTMQLRYTAILLRIAIRENLKSVRKKSGNCFLKLCGHPVSIFDL